MLRRQMSLPLLGNADTLAELQKTDPSPLTDDIKEVLQDAIAILVPLQEFEEVLVSPWLMILLTPIERRFLATR